jgi:hypothetical protein
MSRIAGKNARGRVDGSRPLRESDDRYAPRANPASEPLTEPERSCQARSSVVAMWQRCPAREWRAGWAGVSGSTMRAIRYDRYGPPEVLEPRDIDMPAVGDQEVTVRVRAASVSPLAGSYFRPGSPGPGLAGTFGAMRMCGDGSSCLKGPSVRAGSTAQRRRGIRGPGRHGASDGGAGKGALTRGARQ